MMPYLDSNHFLCFLVKGLVHCAEGTFSQDFTECVIGTIFFILLQFLQVSDGLVRHSFSALVICVAIAGSMLPLKLIAFSPLILINGVIALIPDHVITTFVINLDPSHLNITLLQKCLHLRTDALLIFHIDFTALISLK